MNRHKLLKGRCHIELSADEREKLDTQKESGDDQEPTQVVDSDDEDSAQVEDTSVAVNNDIAVAEDPAPKKKRVIKKKAAGGSE